MPTGYTAPVADGTITTLRDFALRCSRAFGALVSMRDDPLDAPLPEKLIPSDWNFTRLVEARQRLATLQSMSDAEKTAAAEAWNRGNEAAKQKYLAENNERRSRYQAMIAKVEAWEGAPEGLKPFMLSQLNSSLEFDVSDDPLRFHPAARSVEEWFEAELKEALRLIEYHDKEHRAEVERVAERQAWLDQLRASLPAEGDRHAG